MTAMVVGSVALVVGLLLGGLLARRPAPAPVAVEAPAVEAPPVRALEALLGSLQTGAVVVDLSGRVVYANGCAEALGVTRAGQVVVPALTRLLREAGAPGSPSLLEMDLPAGRETRAVRARAERSPDGQHALLLVDDTTESRRVEAVRRDFVANVSHELKTPVGALALLAEALSADAGDPETVRRFADRMVHESGRLSRLVQELIDLSRVQGAEPGERAPVPIGAVVAEAVDRVRLAADARAITVVTGGELSAVVPGDERQLVTAVANLLDNAVAYSSEGTRVSVGARVREGQLELSVADEGIGIAPEDLSRVFERFYRADPARSRATGGTGLGLAIVKHVAGNHGGHVSVWSVEGTGSTFTLHLPTTEATAEASLPPGRATA